MNIGIYCRRSYFSDTSESTKMQIDACRDYIDRCLGKSNSVLIYEDDGYIRSEIDRPGMNRLRQDVADGLLDCVMVYRIDRITSKMDTFCYLYAFLKDRGVKFITVKDGIDTTTPIGEAMMYLAVIFSNIEVENDTLRITDNLNHLAASGYWCGGRPPVGFDIQQVPIGGGKSHKVLVVNEAAKAWKDRIVELWLSGRFSLQALETYCRQNGIKSYSGSFLSTSQLHTILKSPFCVAATGKMYDYYRAMGCQIDDACPREKWDGSSAIMVYGRTTERRTKGKKTHRATSPDQWRISLAQWAPYMSDDTYLRIMDLFGRNVYDKQMKHDITLLKGVLRCKCGRLMQLSRKTKIDGSVSTWYKCVARERQGAEVCDMSAIKAELLDEKVLDIFRSIQLDPAAIRKYVKIDAKTPADASERARKALVKIEGKIDRLTSALAENGSSAAAKYIVKQIEDLDIEAVKIRSDLSRACVETRRAQKDLASAQERRREIIELMENIDKFTPDERNEIARSVIKEAVWDGETLKITL